MCADNFVNINHNFYDKELKMILQDLSPLHLCTFRDKFETGGHFLLVNYHGMCHILLE